VAARYLQSISVATICFTIWFIFTSTHSFADVMANRRSLAEIGLMTVVAFPVFWIVAAMCSAAPCVMLAWIVKRLQIRALAFYLCAGIVLGLFAVLVWVELYNSISLYTDPPDKVRMDVARGLAIFAAPLGFVGGIAGMVFWRLSTRQILES
jgi:asparagine N-glycosylation enzyme membrane subunit Stt3